MSRSPTDQAMTSIATRPFWSTLVQDNTKDLPSSSTTLTPLSVDDPNPSLASISVQPVSLDTPQPTTTLVASDHLSLPLAAPLSVELSPPSSLESSTLEQIVRSEPPPRVPVARFAPVDSTAERSDMWTSILQQESPIPLAQAATIAPKVAPASDSMAHRQGSRVKRKNQDWMSLLGKWREPTPTASRAAIPAARWTSPPLTQSTESGESAFARLLVETPAEQMTEFLPEAMQPPMEVPNVQVPDVVLRAWHTQTIESPKVPNPAPKWPGFQKDLSAESALAMFASVPPSAKATPPQEVSERSSAPAAPAPRILDSRLVELFTPKAAPEVKPTPTRERGPDNERDVYHRNQGPRIDGPRSREDVREWTPRREGPPQVRSALEVMLEMAEKGKRNAAEKQRRELKYESSNIFCFCTHLLFAF